MAFALPLFFSRILDANSDVLSGGKFYVFEAGTTTPTDFYTTSALSVAHPNPLSADSGGLFANCFFAAGDYKLRWTTSAGVTVIEIDNYHLEEEGTQIDFPVSVKTANFSVLAADRGKVFLVDASGGNVAVSADSETLGSGFPFFVVDTGASGTITIAGTGAQTVDGAASKSLSTQNAALGFVSKGASGWQTITSTDFSALALLASANTFTANQTVQSTDAGAGAGPDMIVDRNSASPAGSDLLGRFVVKGRDSGGNATEYAVFSGLISDPTNGSEDAWAFIATMVAGVLANRFYVANGIFTPNATGGDQGLDTINAKAYYDDGVLLAPNRWTQVFKTADETITSDNTLTSDSALQFTADASGVYVIRVKLFMTAHSGCDFKFQLNGPSAAGQASYKSWGENSTFANSGGTEFSASTNYASGTVLFSAGGTNEGTLELEATVTVGGSGGTIALQWAQNTNTADSLTLNKGSYLEYAKLN